MRKILLTTDLSGAAANAADFAVYLANKTGAELHLLYCYKTKYEDHIQRKMDELDPEKMLYGEITDFRDAASFLLRRYSADLRMRVKSSLHEHIVDGSFQDIVFDFIENEQVDLVVMASQGINSIEDRIFGSNALKILRSSVCPVLIVPHKYNDVKIEKILYSTEISNKDKAIEHYLVWFAEMFEAHLTLLHIDDGKHIINAKDLVQFQRKVLHFNYHNISAEIEPSVSISDGIAEYIDNNGADLLCITSHTNTFIDRFFKTSTVKNTLAKISIPVLGFNIESLKRIEKNRKK
jgi:nucleotide-binding universal stress UspA family protein